MATPQFQYDFVFASVYDIIFVDIFFFFMQWWIIEIYNDPARYFLYWVYNLWFCIPYFLVWNRNGRNRGFIGIEIKVLSNKTRTPWLNREQSYWEIMRQLRQKQSWTLQRTFTQINNVQYFKTSISSLRWNADVFIL